MFRTMLARGRARAGLAVAAMAVVFIDELVDGTRGAALPLMRHDLALTYAQVGLLFSVPLVLGSLIELPMGMLAGYGLRRRRTALAGGLAFVAALATTATARSFPVLLVAMVAFFPASGAFVSLTEADLMDANPARRERYMAAWTLAGSLGAMAGPGLLVVVLVYRGTWRVAFAVLAIGAALVAMGLAGLGGRNAAEVTSSELARQSSGRDLLVALRDRTVVRWLVLLQISDLLLDVLTGFVALYFVDVVHTGPAWGAAAIAVRLGAGVASEAVLVPVLGRVDPRRVLAVGAAAAVVAYPAFLVVPGPAWKVVALAGLSVATAPWYPVLQAQLYRSLPDHSAVAVTLSSAATLVGGVAPFIVGVVAERLGLAAALAGLVAVAPFMLVALPGRATRPRG